MGRKPKKYWRYSSAKSFYKNALLYIDKEVLRIEDSIERFNEDTRKKIRKEIINYRHLIDTDAKAYDILESGCKIVSKDVRDWADFSTSINSSMEDIAIRILLGEMFKFNYVCICMLSSNITINEDFINDIIYMTSKYFRFSEWDDKHVNAVTDCAASGDIPSKNSKMIKVYGKDRLTTSLIVVKFDFKNYIGEMSPEFRDKYIRFLIKNF